MSNEQETTLSTITNESSEPPSLPGPFEDELWDVPATEEDVEKATAHLVALCEPAASEDRVNILTRQMKTYDYTRAELMLAMREVPRDPEAAHNYGKGFRISDVERIVKRSRKMRARLKQKLTRSAMMELLEEYPDALDRGDFHPCGFNEHNEALYRYLPEVNRLPGQPNSGEEKKPKALLEVDDLPGADRERDGTHKAMRLGESITED